jgi:hypothetical protein
MSALYTSVQLTNKKYYICVYCCECKLGLSEQAPFTSEIMHLILTALPMNDTYSENSAAL